MSKATHRASRARLMFWTFSVVLAICVLVYMFTQCLDLMNKPSTSDFIAGFLGIFVMFVILVEIGFKFAEFLKWWIKEKGDVDEKSKEGVSP